MTSGTSASPLLIDIPLRWSDMDAYAHVNNATFVTLVEEARVVALHEWFGDSGLLESGVVVTGQEIDYTAQLRYRSEPVVAEIWCSRLGASSFTLACRLRDPDSMGGTTYCLAETTLVRYDAAGGHTRRLGEAERAVFERHLGDPAPLHRRRRQDGR